MEKKYVDAVIDAIQKSSGGLKNFQDEMKKLLITDPSLFVRDRVIRYMVGVLACNGYFKHTKTWRSYLVKNHSFEFTTVAMTRMCGHCAGNGTYGVHYDWNPVVGDYVKLLPPRIERCGVCDGTGKRTADGLEASYNGVRLTLEED